MNCFIDYLYTTMKKKETKKDKGFRDPDFALGKENYRLMAIGFAVIIIGFILMVGGGSDDPEVFNPGIFSFRRITLAPLLLLFGFLFEIYAILKKPKDNG